MQMESIGYHGDGLCLTCGKPLNTYADMTARVSPLRRYCSNACRQAAYRRRQRVRTRMAPFFPGEEVVLATIAREREANARRHQELEDLHRRIFRERDELAQSVINQPPWYVRFWRKVKR